MTDALPGEGHGAVSSYEPMRFLAPLMVTVFAVMTVAGVAALVGSIAAGDDGEVIVFVSLWLLFVVGLAWYGLTRVATVVHTDAAGLTWQAVAARGRVEWGDLAAVASRSNHLVLRGRSSHPIRVLAAKGVGGFVAEIHRHCPGVEVRLGAYARFVDRQTGPSTWHPRP